MSIQLSSKPEAVGDRRTIRFPMKREKTGYRRGPRFRRVVDVEQVQKTSGVGQTCAARMITLAIVDRDQALRENRPGHAKISRAQMRVSALWARLFAKQISDSDPRVDEALRNSRALVQQFCGRVTLFQPNPNRHAID